jgi:hypothetical protein
MLQTVIMSWVSTCPGSVGIFMQNVLTFPEGMIALLLPCVCLLGIVNGSLYLLFVCLFVVCLFVFAVTDTSPESEKDNLNYDLFFFVSADHGSKTEC